MANEFGFSDTGVEREINSAFVVIARENHSGLGVFLGGLAGTAGAVLGGLVGMSVTGDVKKEVKRILVAFDNEDLVTTFDLSPAELAEKRIEIGTRILVERNYSGGFTVTVPQ